MPKREVVRRDRGWRGGVMVVRIEKGFSFFFLFFSRWRREGHVVAFGKD